MILDDPDLPLINSGRRGAKHFPFQIERFFKLQDDEILSKCDNLFFHDKEFVVTFGHPFSSIMSSYYIQGDFFPVSFSASLFFLSFCLSVYLIAFLSFR